MEKKLLFVVLFNLILCNYLIAQTTEWLHTWGGNKEDAITSTALDQNGNIIAAGYTNSFGYGTTNVLLQKYDSLGNLLWSTTWGGSTSDAASSVATDKNNNIYLVGSTSSYGSGWYDVLILKFNPNGSLVWSKTWGGSSYDAGYGIAIDSQGNLLISAESYSFGSSAILLKLDSNGNYIWCKSWKSSVSYDAAYSITSDLTGNIILTGISWDYSQSPNVNKILILKYDSNGNLLWSRNWGSSGLDEAWGSRVIKTDNDGNIYIAGRTQYGSGSMDALLLKLDSNGNYKWSKNWGGKDYDTNIGIDLDSNGNLYTVGYTKSFTNGQSNLFLLKYDNSGNLLSSNIWNDNNDSQGNTILINQSKIIIGGQSYNVSGNWENVNGSTGNPSNSLFTPSYNVSSLSDASNNVNGQTTTPTGTKDSGGGNIDALIINFKLSTSQTSFLAFPLKDFTPYNAPIVSVFDHSGNRYCPNDTVIDFIGEVAAVKDLYEPPAQSNCGYLYSYKKNDGSNFLSQVANYVGTRGTGPATLNYDGYPGYDYRVDTGTAVYASADGKVIIAHDKDDSGSGKYIRILHDNDYETQYLHLNEINVLVGQNVKVGDLIGYSGNTGGVSPHLHFEVKKILNNDTISVDPYGWQGNGTDPYTLLTSVVNYNLWLTNSPDNYTTIMDELNGSSIGIATGITYAPALSGSGAVFSRINESRISYPFTYGIPKEGTLEWWVNIQSGYWYDNYALYDNQSSAQLFGSDAHGGDVNWPGMMKLIVFSNGQIQLTTGNTYGQADYHLLTAASSSFTFNHWHSIGISFGSNGQYIMIDGSLVVSDPTYTQQLGSAGNFSAPVDTPTIGQCISGFWNHDQYDGGFNGIVDRFRASSKQEDWVLSKSSITGINDKVTDIAKSFYLSQNFPNPFNPSTTINYSLPKTSFVTIKVYDILGREISTLINSEKLPGNYEIKFDGINLSSGIYFYQMRAGDFVEVRKFVLMK